MQIYFGIINNGLPTNVVLEVERKSVVIETAAISIDGFTEANLLDVEYGDTIRVMAHAPDYTAPIVPTEPVQEVETEPAHEVEPGQEAEQSAD